MDIQHYGLFGRVSTKISKFKLKRVYATRNTSIPVNLPGDQEGLFKLAIQLRKFLFITL
jgi:hypothetical protein